MRCAKQVRQPDKVKKMTLFGPDADDDSDGAEENLEVARLMELNTDAIAELRLAGLSELEIMEALRWAFSFTPFSSTW